MQTTTKLSVALGVAVLSAPAVAVAASQTPIQVFGIKHVADGYVIEVPYSDLDLRQPSEVRVLSARVDRAARQVCAPNLYTPRFDALAEKACVDGALTEAAPQLSLARKRAQEFAATGTSAIPQVAVAIGASF